MIQIELNKARAIIIIYIVSIIVASIFITNYMNQKLGNELFPTSITKEIEITKTITVEKHNIYCSMANIQNYPIILSEYGFSVRIINHTENIVFAEEEVEHFWITSKFLVKHTFFPYNRHVIEIMDGDAEGSKIDITFEKIESGTRLKSKIDMEFKGLLVGLGLIPNENLKHAINTVFVPFEKDAMSKDYSC